MFYLIKIHSTVHKFKICLPHTDCILQILCKIKFTATQILRVINSGHFEAPKLRFLAILAALNFKFLGFFDIYKCEIPQKSKFNLLKTAKVDFT